MPFASKATPPTDVRAVPDPTPGPVTTARLPVASSIDSTVPAPAFVEPT
ncbi:MAG: hypothetical protein U1E39_01910 [Planctomycetota bacterium]